MSIPDIVVITTLVFLVPKLVNRYLWRYGFVRELRLVIVIGGLLWIVFSCCHEIGYWVVGTADSDSHKFEAKWYPMIVKYIESGNYSELVKTLLTPGRFFYITYQGILYYYTGITVISILAINAFMAFWGGLTLTRLIYSFSSLQPPRKDVLPLFLIFTPSIVFWSAANLKEALMYWSICQVLNFMMPTRTSKGENINFGLFVFGLCLGSLLRPHLIIIWFAAVLIVKMRQPRFWKYLIVLMLLTPLFVPQFGKRFNLAKFGTDPIAALFDYKKAAEMKHEQFVMRANSRGNIRSTFTYDEGLPIPIFHGATNVMFRPFLWRIETLRSMLASLEIWTISLCIIFLWMRMTTLEWRTILCNPLVRVALLVSFPFFFFFTYTPNEGWIARQRVQMFPVLLIMFSMPLLQRRYYISIDKIRRHGFRKTSHLKAALSISKEGT